MVRVDLILERRTGDTFRVIAPFAVVSLFVFPLALGARTSLLREAGTGIYWALGVLFGMLIALRQSASDSPERRDMQAMVGLDPAARFVARTISGSALMFGFFAVLFLGMLAFLNAEVSAGTWPVIVTATALAGIGLTELGTLAGEITAGLRGRATLASLIVAPLALPLVIGAAESVRALERDAGILTWILLLIACDLALAVAGVALAKPLEEATR